MAGLISIVFGIFNLALSAVIYWALWSYLNHMYGETLHLQVAILNIGGKVELITKPLGLVVGVIGLYLKPRRKSLAIIGASINALVILWTIALFAGLVI